MANAFVQSLTLEGFLSFGPAPVTLPMRQLNVVIGPNGSGKSNLVEALSVLQAIPRDLPLPIRRGGGVQDWLFKGETEAEQACLEVVISAGHVSRFPARASATRYRLIFASEGGSFVVRDERLEDAEAAPGKAKPYFYFGYESGRPMLNVNRQQRELKREDVDPTQSILSQRRDPDLYPELTRLADALQRILVYRSWPFGPDSELRESCRPDVRTDVLSEAFDNMPARIAALKRDPAVKKRLVGELRELAPGFDDVEVVPEGGRLQLYLTEGQRNVPAQRLSDGTLRYLALLTILLDPSPGPLIAIEEPELGLHFDMMPRIAEHLIEASERTQLLVTTHSDALIDALGETPESVVICEKRGASTSLRRLEPGEASELPEPVSLGSLWTRGALGGTRW